MENLIPARSQHFEGIEDELFDIIVIGGGITGAGVARDATLRGLNVALFEKNDFGSGTSMATSKMLHGGLRYLENHEFRLVRHAALERKVHLEIAPHLAEIMPLLLPYYNWMQVSKFKLKVGLITYDLLAMPKGIGRHKSLSKKKIVERMEALDSPELVGGFVYNDVKTDDTRLTLANILSSAAGGARTLNYTEVTSWHQESEYSEVYILDKLSGIKYVTKGKVLIICGGPWSDIIENRGMDFEGEANLRLTRGTHILLKSRPGSNPCLIQNNDGRPIFIIPHLDYDLAGTTDIDYSGHPDDVKPTMDEVEYILDACNQLFPEAKYTKEDVVAAFVGLRPLILEDGVKEGKVSRDHKINVDPRGVITVLGGKLTTYRRMAKDAINQARKLLDDQSISSRSVTDKLPLWGGEMDSWKEFQQEKIPYLEETYQISTKTAKMLLQWYGSEIDFIELILKEVGSKLLSDTRPWLEAQVVYGCRVEYVQTPIDMLRRRVPIMLEEDNGLLILDRVIEIMSNELNWDKATSNQMKQNYVKYVSEFIQTS